MIVRHVEILEYRKHVLGSLEYKNMPILVLLVVVNPNHQHRTMTAERPPYLLLTAASESDPTVGEGGTRRGSELWDPIRQQ